jgi:tetratricopeptide (TPR) repeat protein
VTTVSLEAYKHFFEGDRYMNDLEFKKAAQELEKAIELDSTFALAQYKLAYVQWWSQHELDAAEQHVHAAMKAIDRIPEKEQFLVKALNASLEHGFNAQLPYLREMQKLYPNDKEMLFSIGDISFHTENYDTAQVYFERVLELDPEFERALQHLTWTYLRTGQVEKGYEMAQNWVDRTHSWEAYQYLGNAAFMMGNPDEAVAHFEKASELTPEMVYTKRALAGSYLFSGQPEKAMAQLKGVVEGDFKPKERFTAYHDISGFVLPYLGRFEEALQMSLAGLDTLEARGDTATLLDARIGTASLYYWAYHDTDSMWKLAESTYDYPDSVKSTSYWMNLSAINLITGRVETGTEIFEAHNEEKMAVPLFKSLAAAGQNDCVTSEAWLDSVVAIPPAQYASVIFRTALCYYDNADYESAARNLSVVVDPTNAMLQNAPAIIFSRYYLAKCYDAMGKSAEALVSYRQFLKVWKDADEDQAKLTDARARVAALEAAGSM